MNKENDLGSDQMKRIKTYCCILQCRSTRSSVACEVALGVLPPMATKHAFEGVGEDELCVVYVYGIV